MALAPSPLDRGGLSGKEKLAKARWARGMNGVLPAQRGNAPAKRLGKRSLKHETGQLRQVSKSHYDGDLQARPPVRVPRRAT